MSYKYRRKVKLRHQQQALQNKPDVFTEEVCHSIECEHGGRNSNAHIRRFTQATERLAEEVWGTNASTSAIVRKWDDFVLGQLLDAVQQTDEGKEAACEICLDQTARQFSEKTQLRSLREGQSRLLSRPLRIWAIDTLDLQIYVTSAYVQLLRSSPLHIVKSAMTAYTTLFLKCSSGRGFKLDQLCLASDSQKLLETPNAGGSSIESEVLSFELLQRIMPYWSLSTMEMNTKYATSGPILDFVTKSSAGSEVEWCVSVTRIFGWCRSLQISASALTPLLMRKLSGLQSATARVLPKKLRGMVIFIWVPDGSVEKNVRRAWKRLTVSEPSLVRAVICFVGVCQKESWMDTTGWEHKFGSCSE